jgi:hypothetical protein
MSGRIFISSTCYDLLDLRAEIETHLRDLGLTPILSDRPSSDFAVDPKADSIETCLVNVRGSDAFVCVLSQRYGPSLKKAGFPDVSATHLEWQEAKSLGKPIYFYVRDRTEAEYAIWKKNRGAVGNFAWVQDSKVFEFLDEHRTLVKAADATNWLWPFRDSVELKQRLADDLGAISRQALLRRLLVDGLLPTIKVQIRRRNGGGAGQDVAFDTGFAGRGKHGAFDIYLLMDGGKVLLGDLPPGGELARTFKYKTPPNDQVFEKRFTLEYETERGHQIQDDFVLRYDTKATDVGVTFEHAAKRLVGGPRFKIE